MLRSLDLEHRQDIDDRGEEKQDGESIQKEPAFSHDRANAVWTDPLASLFTPRFEVSNRTQHNGPSAVAHHGLA